MLRVLNLKKSILLDQAKQKVIDEVITGEAYLNVIMFGATSAFGKDTTISELFKDTGDEIKLDEEAYIFLGRFPSRCNVRSLFSYGNT